MGDRDYLLVTYFLEVVHRRHPFLYPPKDTPPRMTTLTKENLHYLNEASGEAISSCSGEIVAEFYWRGKVKPMFNFFFAGEDPKRPRHATVTDDDKIYDYCEKKAFDTLEAWHADVALMYPHIQLADLRFGQPYVIVLTAVEIEALMGWEHTPLTAPVAAPGAGAGATPEPERLSEEE